MVLESGKITPENVDRLRARLGSFNRPRQYGVGLFNEQASRDAIRHFCQGIGDANPLYWDLSYGQATKYGSIIAPPCFLYSVYWCSGRTGGLPGVHGFHAGNDWECTGQSTWTTRFRSRNSSPGWKRRKASSPGIY